MPRHLEPYQEAFVLHFPSSSNLCLFRFQEESAALAYIQLSFAGIYVTHYIGTYSAFP